MRFACERAALGGVRVGAHVSYRDRAGFGRRDVEVSTTQLRADVTEQLEALANVARAAGIAVTYVKPHGALYNRCARDPVQAAVVAQAVAEFDPALIVMSLPHSELIVAARDRGLAAVSEGYADRGYRPDGGLVQRDQPGAVLDQRAAVAQALELVTRGFTRASDGSQLELKVQSLCLHSDTPGAPELAVALRAAFAQAGVAVKPFA